MLSGARKNVCGFFAGDEFFIIVLGHDLFTWSFLRLLQIGFFKFKFNFKTLKLFCYSDMWLFLSRERLLALEIFFHFVRINRE